MSSDESAEQPAAQPADQPTPGADGPAQQRTTGQPGQPEVMEQLREIRGSIDNLDAVLVGVLAERFKATQRVGQLKAAHNLPAGDPQRESRQIDRLRRLAQEASLDPEFAEKILGFIITEVIRHHERIAEEHRSGREL